MRAFLKGSVNNSDIKAEYRPHIEYKQAHLPNEWFNILFYEVSAQFK